MGGSFEEMEEKGNPLPHLLHRTSTTTIWRARRFLRTLSGHPRWPQRYDQLAYAPPDVCSPSFLALLPISLHFLSPGSAITCKVLARVLLL